MHYDVAPQKNSDILYTRTLHAMAARHQEGRYETTTVSSRMFLFAKDCISKDDVGVAGDTASQERRPGAGFGNRRFREKEALEGLLPPSNNSEREQEKDVWDSFDMCAQIRRVLRSLLLV